MRSRNMRRSVFSVATAIAVLALTAGSVVAALTWKSGPTFVQNSNGSFTATGEATGLGNTPVIATIVVSGTVRYTCVNKGSNPSPGQNPVPSTTSGSQDLGNSDHNGRGVLDLTVSFAPAATVGGKTAGCPNGNWQGVNPQQQGPVSATLTLTQGGKVIYTAKLP